MHLIAADWYDVVQDRFPLDRTVALLRIVRWLAVVPLILLLMLMFFEDSLIFIPSRYPEGDWQPRELVFEDAWFIAGDGTKLHGWFFAGR